MGSCCCKPKKEEEDSDTLLNKTEHSTSLCAAQCSWDSATSSDMMKFIDHDQYTSLKIIETCFSMFTGDQELFHNLSLKVKDLSKLESDEKLMLYGEIRHEETEILKKFIYTFHENFKGLQEFTTKKYSVIESRVESLDSFLKNSSAFVQEREKIVEKLKKINNLGKNDFSQILEVLVKLEKINEELMDIEKFLVSGQEVVDRVKEVEKNLEELSKISLVTTHNFEVIFGDVTVVEKIDERELKAVELGNKMYVNVFEDIGKCLKNLHELEKLKNTALEKNSIKEKLDEIDKTLTKHFLHSEQSKEVAYTKLNRVSRSQTEYKTPLHLHLLQYELTEKSIPRAITRLHEKAERYSHSLEHKDKILLEMTEKLNTIDSIIDEIELKFHEFISTEVKELHKWVSSTETSIKDSLESLSEKILQYEEDTKHDLMERLASFQTKFSLTDDLNIIKSALKEIHTKELTRVKTEMHEKVNELSNKLDELHNEKNLNDSSHMSTKLQLQKTSKITEELLKEKQEKDLVVSELKGKINSLEETIDQMVQEKNLLQDEVDDLQKNLRECKKALRTKEHELAELNESLKSA